MFPLLPVSVRNFITCNAPILTILVPMSICWIATEMLDLPISPVYGMAACCAVGVYGAYREARILKGMKHDLEPNLYKGAMRHTVKLFCLQALVFILSIATLLGYTHDKKGFGLLFILGIGLFM